ncbi:MAG: hypothetical protein M2R45_03096 [Verrucomicrobia subdivision 3 bacterium]|nr:hypothetical protein [Limisphaerales bacterium]MCS1413164.1 hypothetical protein [Limisphaerales bacterium]
MLPSATEIMHSLDLTQNLVGRSRKCDYPICISNLPTVTFAHVHPKAPSHMIDRDCQSQRLRQSLSLYGIREDRIRELAPDYVITQTQCKVCAVSLNDVKTFLKNGLGGTVDLLALTPNTLDKVWDNIWRTSAPA